MMNEQERKRIELLEKIKADETKISVADVTDLFCSTLKMFMENTNTFKTIAAKITEADKVKFITGLSMSFLASLYVSAAEDKAEQERRIRITHETNKDILKGYAIKREKDYDA